MGRDPISGKGKRGQIGRYFTGFQEIEIRFTVRVFNQQPNIPRIIFFVIADDHYSFLEIV